MEALRKHKAVILAGGKGTRLYPVTKEIPKPLLPVKRRPILNYLVDLFSSFGIGEIAILINKEFQEEFFWWQRRYYPFSLRPFRKRLKIRFLGETEPLGTFGGLWYLKDWIGKNPFFFSNGDELKEIDLKKMKDFHQKLQVSATIALVKVPDPQNYGVVLCKDNIVCEFLEKPKDPPTKYISSGLYLLNPEIFNFHPGPKFSMIEKDLFPRLAQEKRLGAFPFNGKWFDCGTWERYEKALQEWGNE